MKDDLPRPDEEPAEESFADILKQFESTERKAPAGPRHGTVVGVSGDYVLIDYGSKAEGVIPTADLLDAEGKLSVKRGDRFDVTITGRNSEGMVTLARITAPRPKDWEGLTRAFENQQIVSGRVTGAVKGGFTVDLGTRAFLPASRSGVRTPEEMEQLVGQEIRCRIIKIDVENEDVVVDRRSVIEEEARQIRQTTVEALQEGAIVHGTVRSLTNYGAFVDIGGVDGLLHVSDMSWSRVSDPSTLLSAGQELNVKILKVDKETGKIALGLKQMSPGPWETIKDRYPNGKIVEGKITRLAKFGAFVQVEDGVEGLIHVSDFTSERRIQHPSEFVKPGQVVRAVVLSAEPETKRLKLGMKQLEATAADKFVQQVAVGDRVTGRVIAVRGNEVRVQLDEGIEGVCLLEEASSGGDSTARGGSLAEQLAAAWKSGVKPPSAGVSDPYRVGQVRSFTIKAIEPSAKKIELAPVS